MLDSPVFPRSIPLSASLYSISGDSLSEVFEVVPGVDRTWALPLCVSLSFWDLFLVVCWAEMPGSAIEAGGNSELLLAVCLDFIV